MSADPAPLPNNQPVFPQHHHAHGKQSDPYKHFLNTLSSAYAIGNIQLAGSAKLCALQELCGRASGCDFSEPPSGCDVKTGRLLDEPASKCA